MKLIESYNVKGAIMMGRSSAILSFLAFAAAAFTASGARVVDLTAAARSAGTSAYSVTSTSTDSARPPKNAFDGTYDKNSAMCFRSVNGDGKDVTLTYQFSDSFNAGKYIRLTSYLIYFNSGWSGSGDARYPCQMPAAWTFEGSNDGDSWTVLDTQSGLAASSYVAGSYNSFPVRAQACYRRYRLHFTDICNSNENNQYYIIAEIRFDGCILDSESDINSTRFWNGGAEGDWEEASNWTAGPSGATAPQAGEDVVIGDAGNATVRISSPTAALSSLHVAGYGSSVTLETTNWTTCVEAGDITLAKGAVVTCCQASTNAADIGRVWLKCDNFKMDSGASINVDAKGYASMPTTSSHAQRGGVGPGGGSRYAGGAHGGYGANSFLDNAATPTATYGSAEEPDTPGSSGFTFYGRGGYGGGVVRIEASGHVLMNGTITANGGNVTQYDKSYSGTNRDGAGSGGSIYVTAATFASTNGVLRANGGNGSGLSSNGKITGKDCVSCAGGGGRIAVHYDAAAQQAGFVKDAMFSAAAGRYAGGGYNAGQQYAPTLARMDDSWVDADIGTLWFSDEKLLNGLGSKLYGQIRGIDSLSLDSLVFGAGHVRFPAGFSLNVAGDLSVTGTNARLEIGGDFPTNLWRHPTLCSCSPAHLVVGGNLRLEKGGRLDVRAAATNGVDAFGAQVDVVGDFVVESNSACYAWCDAFNGGAPRFDVGNMRVELGGTLTAAERGFAAGWAVDSTLVRANGYGPGAGKSTSSGASALGGGGGHGGRGGKQGASASGATYDDPYSPSLPGSGGAVNWKYSAQGGVGGGVVCVCATNSIVVDGTVSADGQKTPSDYAGGGAGGSVYLCAPSVYGAATGLISAKGGNPHASTTLYKYNAGGGGGRIAIWTGEKYVKGAGLARRKSLTPVADEDGNVFLGTCSVDGGVSSYDDETNVYSGAEGTVRYVNVIRSGIILRFL